MIQKFVKNIFGTRSDREVKQLYPIVENINAVNDEHGRKMLINKLRKEMRKGLEKEYMLHEEDRILIYKFFNKLKSEINSVENN